MKTLNLINKSREYLDYVEEHYKNVQKAWLVIAEKCADMQFVYDDFMFHTIAAEIEAHDLSKLSACEFVQYRRNFFLAENEECDPPAVFKHAWEHHKTHNPHHWESWTQGKQTYPNESTVHCVHMVADWMAMGYKFGDTAQEFFEKTKHDMDLPQWAHNLLFSIFDRVYGDDS